MQSHSRLKWARLKWNLCVPRYKFALYGATKSYNHILSSGIEECYGDKIDVMTVIPRQTKTKMNPADYMFTVSPETHAKAVIDQEHYSVYWLNVVRKIDSNR